MSDISIWQTVIKSSSSLLTIGLGGFYLIKMNAIKAQDLKVISNCIEKLFIPAMIFSKFVAVMDTLDFGSWVPVCLFSIIICLSGLLIGYLMKKAFLNNDDIYGEVLMLQTSLGHTTGIQLILLISLQSELQKLSESYSQYNNYTYKENNALTRGIFYVMMITQISSIIRWTLGKKIIQQLAQKYIQQNQANESNQDDLQIVEESQEQKISVYLNAPVIASLSTFFICTFPLLKDQFSKPGYPIHDSFMKSVEIVGSIAPGLGLVCLGANCALMNSDIKKGDVSFKILLICIISRLIINPLFGSFIIYTLLYLQWITDPVQAFIYMISYVTPPAINLLIHSQRYSIELSKNIAKILIIQYLIFSFVLLPIIMIIYLNLFSQF